MARDLDVPAFLQPVIDLLDAHIHPFAVYLFGSGAKGTLRNDSDLDLAFLAPTSPAPYDLFLLAQKAADLVHRDVDLINLQAVDTVFQAQIVATGKRIVNRDGARVAAFQIRALKEYALLNEERAVVLQTIQDRGSLYD